MYSPSMKRSMTYTGAPSRSTHSITCASITSIGFGGFCLSNAAAYAAAVAWRSTSS